MSHVSTIAGDENQSSVSDYILVVDDEEALRQIIGRTLEREGYTVQLAAGGKEALALMEECIPDMVILDIKMPGLNGFQVLEEIRKKSAMPVIMLSGLGQATTISDALLEGADDFLQKPFRAHELLGRVQNRLRKQS